MANSENLWLQWPTYLAWGALSRSMNILDSLQPTLILRRMELIPCGLIWIQVMRI